MTATRIYWESTLRHHRDTLRALEEGELHRLTGAHLSRQFAGKPVAWTLAQEHRAHVRLLVNNFLESSWDTAVDHIAERERAVVDAEILIVRDAVIQWHYLGLVGLREKDRARAKGAERAASREINRWRLATCLWEAKPTVGQPSTGSPFGHE